MAVVSTAWPAEDPETGILTGNVRDAVTGKPVPFADVIVIGTGRGSIVQQNGTFTLTGLPPGIHEISVQRIDYTTRTIAGVALLPGRPRNLIVRLDPSDVTVETIVITTDVTDIDVKASSSTYRIDRNDFKNRAINNITDALAKQPGVVVDPTGEIHVRGGRNDEVKYVVDGMPVTNALHTNASLDVSFAALSQLELLSGGYDAEYGNAQSGIVRIQTMEGGRSYSGLAKFFTDDYGADDKTFFNSDDITAAIGGPLITGQLRFYLSGAGHFSDGHLPINRECGKREVLGITLRDRNSNQYQGQGKLTWYFSPEKKLSAGALMNRKKWTSYRHDYSRVGWWSPENAHWWYEPLDSTYQFYAGPDHLPVETRLDVQSSLHWTHTLSPRLYYTLKLARLSSDYLQQVGNLDPEEYQPFLGGADQIDPRNGYFAVDGDFPRYEKYGTRTYTFKGDLTNQTNDAHRLKMGLQLDYFDMESLVAINPDSIRPLGTAPDHYRVYSSGGALYVQDQFQHEGMVINAGIRWDFFDPGLRAARLDKARRAGLLTETGEHISLQSRLKSQLSPRIGMAYPITDRDVLHFQYGRFSQMPALHQLFAGIGAKNLEPGGLYGNLELEPTQNISYQLGVDHKLTGSLSLDMTLFYRDIFGWIDTREIAAGTLSSIGAEPAYTFINQAYGTVRGFEFVLNRRFQKRFGGSLTYTFSQATGTHSDANTAVLVGLGQLNRKPLSEQPLDWDKTHMFGAELRLSDPGIWLLSLEYEYRGGAPYTPLFYGQRKILAEEINTGRLPDESNVDLKANKLYRMYGQEFRLYVEGSNLLDNQNIRDFDPGGEGLYSEYYTEAGGLGGAYNLHEVNASQADRFVSLADPRVFDPGRQIKMGVMIDW